MLTHLERYYHALFFSAVKIEVTATSTCNSHLNQMLVGSVRREIVAVCEYTINQALGINDARRLAPDLRKNVEDFMKRMKLINADGLAGLLHWKLEVPHCRLVKITMGWRSP